MALAATIVWEVRTTGSDTNGGGFKTGASGTDWSQQNAAQYSVTDGVTIGTTTITSLTANFGTDVVGNLVYVAGGTGTLTGVWREITVRNSATSITVDAATGLGSSTGVTLKIGGALLSPGNVGFSKTAGNDVWIKAGTYTVSVNTANVANGKVLDNTGGTAGTNPSRWEGYNATRGDKGTKPIITADGVITTFTLFSITSGAVTVDNITVDGNSRTLSTGFSNTAARVLLVRCKAQGTTVDGFNLASNSAVLYRCEVTGATSASTSAFNFAVSSSAIECEAYGNVCPGFVSSSTTFVSYVRCVSSANSGASSDGFIATGRDGYYGNCVAYNNGRHGFNMSGMGGVVAENCIAEGHVAAVAYGFTSTVGVQQNAELNNCAGFNNTTGNVNATNLPISTAFVTGTATFFTNAGSGDFSLNVTAGGGAAARATGYPGLLPRGTTTGYLDIGAAQHTDPTKMLFTGDEA